MIADEAVAARARRAGLSLPPETIAALVEHARSVLAAEPRLHLTAVTDPEEFLERHVGESLEAAALLPAEASGVLLDLGSGNGYPAIPIGLARPGLRVIMTEASARKACFLQDAARALAPQTMSVLHAHVQRVQDLGEMAPEGIAILTSRAMGNWSRVVPRLVRALAPAGVILLWAGFEVERMVQRAAWRALRIRQRHPLPGRERSWIWLLERADKDVGGPRACFRN